MARPYDQDFALSSASGCHRFLRLGPRAVAGWRGNRLRRHHAPRFLLWSIAALAAADLVVALLKAPPETVGGANPLLPVAGTVVVLLAAAALMPMAGFAVTAVLTFFACGWLMGFRSLGALAVSSVAMALFCWAIFTFAIDLSLPTSPFSRDI